MLIFSNSVVLFSESMACWSMGVECSELYLQNTQNVLLYLAIPFSFRLLCSVVNWNIGLSKALFLVVESKKCNHVQEEIELSLPLNHKELCKY